MSAVYFPTRSGIRARIARRFELLCVTWTLRWAEQDRDHLADQVSALPKRLRQLDRDLEALRLRQAVLRGTC